MKPLKIKLRSIDYNLNRDRCYEVILSKGLFASWIVLIGNGRYGGFSHQRIYSFDNAKEACYFFDKKIRQKVLKRGYKFI